MARSLKDILDKEKPEVVAKAKTMAADMLLEISLAEIRKELEVTQMKVAEAMGVKQPTVAGMEKPGQDMKLSSLKRYVEAAGGKLRLDVELPDGSHKGFSI